MNNVIKIYKLRFEIVDLSGLSYTALKNAQNSLHQKSIWKTKEKFPTKEIIDLGFDQFTSLILKTSFI